jgi:hypothetical protein
MSNILDTIREQVNSLSVDEVKAQLAKINEQKAKQREKHKSKPHAYQKALSDEQLAALTDEQREAYLAKRAKRTEYNKARIQRPEVKAKMKAYHQKPEVKERMKAYHKKRQAEVKAIIARAKELAETNPELAALLAKPAPAVETPVEQPVA